MGTIDTALVHPREVFKKAILNGSSSIIVVHNHPSGDQRPTEEDKKGAKTNDLLRKAGLVEDVLYLHIRRKGKPKYTFLVDTQTGRAANGGMVR